MGSIYQLTFLLSLALLAIVITVFVLAVSLLGRAVKMSSREQIEAEEKRKKDTEDEIKKIQDKLEKAKAAGRVNIEDLSRSLQHLQNRDARHKWKLRWIKTKPKLLTSSWGALVPGAFFMIGAIFSALAPTSPSGTATASLYMWISLIALGIGICFVCLTLKVIEGVAKTSEETAFVREAEVLKTALREFEEEKKPNLEFSFSGVQPPFRMKAESEIVIEFNMLASRGDVARSPTVFFYAPKGFKFPNTLEALPPMIEELANYISSYIEFKDTAIGIYRKGKITIKAPPQPGDYPLFYDCTCEGFPGRLGEFHIIIE